MSRTILLIGEHDKGLGEAFHPSTQSGRRLRAILEPLSVRYIFTNMMSSSSASPSFDDISRLKRDADMCDVVVLLGRRVQCALLPHFSSAVCLPHPASRRIQDIRELRDGLRAIK